MDEKALLKWANSQVEDEDLHIKSFAKKSIRNCQFLFALLSIINNKAINPKLISDGNRVQFSRVIF